MLLLEQLGLRKYEMIVLNEKATIGTYFNIILQKITL
jgi:hypothetical protein